MANWWGESPQQEYFRRQNNKEKWGNAGGPVDAIAHWLFKLFAPILIPVLLVVYFFKLYWMYAIPIAVIVIICFFTCKHFRRMGRSSNLKVLLTILISVGLIGLVFLIVPKRENGGTRTVPVSRTSSQARFMLVNSDALNVRRGPSADHAVVGQLKKDSRVQVLDNSSQWWKIRFGNIEGYVNSAYLTNEANTPSVPTSTRTTNTTSPAVREPGAGTTRAQSFQDVYERAVADYDLTHPSLPPGLVLPDGRTVEEHVDSAPTSGR